MSELDYQLRLNLNRLHVLIVTQSMAKAILAPRDKAELENVRKAFIERAQRPTYNELAGEFGIPHSTIGKYAAQESWIALRAERLEKKLVASDALATIDEAIRVDSTLTRSFSDGVILVLEKVKETINGVDEDRAPQTKLQAYNTASFTLLNLSNTCKNLGLVALGKKLDDAGKEQNGRWNPQLLNNINLTINGLREKAKAEPAPVEPVNDAADAI